MAHKLLILPQIRTKSELAEHIRDGDVVRGDHFDVNLTIKNHGETDFPGGVAKLLRASFGGPAGAEQRIVEEIPIPPLRIGATTVFKKSFWASTTGLGWLHLTVEAADNQPIEYYQAPQAKLEGNEWYFPFYSVDREALQIVALLRRLVEREAK